MCENYPITFTVCPLNFRQPSSQLVFIFLKWCKNANDHKTNHFISFFKVKSLHKNCIIQNESFYMYMKYHSNQSLFTQLSLHSFTVT